MVFAVFKVGSLSFLRILIIFQDFFLLIYARRVVDIFDHPCQIVKILNHFRKIIRIPIKSISTAYINHLVREDSQEKWRFGQLIQIICVKLELWGRNKTFQHFDFVKQTVNLFK